MRYVMSALVVLLACSSLASALELVVLGLGDPQSQRDNELLSLLTGSAVGQQPVVWNWRPVQRQQVAVGIAVPKPALVAQAPQAVVAIKPVQVEKLIVQQQQAKARFILPQQKVRVLGGFRRQRWPRYPQVVAAQFKPCITQLMQALDESDARLFASVWDVENAKFIDVRNGKVVTQHSLTGKAEGRIKRIRRLVRAERLQTWLDAPKPVNVSSDRKSALIHLRNEKRGPILDATSLHLKQKGDGTWMVVALVHSIRGA